MCCSVALVTMCRKTLRADCRPAFPLVSPSFVLTLFSLVSCPTDPDRRLRMPASQVAYTPDGTRVISAGEDGLLCLHDVSQGYHPIRVMACDDPQPGRPIRLSVSSDQPIKSNQVNTADRKSFKSDKHLENECRTGIAVVVSCAAIWT